MSLRLALVGGPMYDGLYRLLEGEDVEVVVRADHPTLNREVAARLARGERIDLLSTHSKYAPSQAAWLRPLDGLVEPGTLAALAPHALELCRFRGSLLSVPRNIDVRVLWRVPYPYWFDVVEVAPEAEVLATFQWSLAPPGEERLRARGLPSRFPAVVRMRGRTGDGTTYYFGGDFADNPLREGRVPFAGYLSFRRWIEGAKLAPSEESFFWRFYAPMLEGILDEIPRRR